MPNSLQLLQMLMMMPGNAPQNHVQVTTEWEMRLSSLLSIQIDDDEYIDVVGNDDDMLQVCFLMLRVFTFFSLSPHDLDL